MADQTDEQVLRKLVRSLRFVKAMMWIFFLMLLVGLLILGYIAYRVVTFSQKVDSRITNIQHTTEQKLDLKRQICNGNVFGPTVTKQLCQ